MQTIKYDGQRTVQDLLAFVCNVFLPDEESIQPSRLKVNTKLAKECIVGSGFEATMLWVNKGPGILDSLSDGTIAYLDPKEK